MAPIDLILVPGHAAFVASVRDLPLDLEGDRWWVLNSFQSGEPPFYVEHIRRALELSSSRPESLVMFSGGRTRRQAGEWSEAETYRAIARTMNATSIADRMHVETFARDSFENLLFSICRFQQITGAYPKAVTVVGWEFKRGRFDQHRAAIRWPAGRFQYVGVNDPCDLDVARKGNDMAVRLFEESPYGSTGALVAKRRERDPYQQRHSYRACAGVGTFLTFVESPENASKVFPERLPWEGWESACEL